MRVNNELDSYMDARKKVEKTRAVRIFLAHLAMFIIGNMFLGLWNSLTYHVKGNELFWFLIPLVFWGTGVLIHYTISVALFNEWWELDELAINSRSGGSESASN